jgi:ATP-dependent 26S proteasome regulatory subunit
MKNCEIRSSSFNDYSFPVVYSCFAIVRCEGIHTELLDSVESVCHHQLNPLKYRRGNLFTDQITSCYFHNCLKLKTLIFTAEDILERPDKDSRFVEILCRLTGFEVLDTACDIELKLKIKELVPADVDSGAVLQYGCRFTENTQVFVVDDLSGATNRYSLCHSSAFNHLKFRMVPHSVKLDESFAGYFDHVHERTFSFLSVFFEKFRGQSLRSPVEKVSHFINQPTLLTTHGYTADGVYLVPYLCRKSLLSLLTVSIGDFLKYDYSASYPSMIQEYFSSIIRYCLAQDYCVLVLNDLHLLKSFKNPKRSVTSSSEYTTESFTYDERCIPPILSCLLSLLQQYSSSYSNNSSSKTNKSVYQRILIVGVTANEESLSKELFSLFPVKLDIGNQYKLNYHQQFQQVCALYGRDDLKVEDFVFGVSPSSEGAKKQAAGSVVTSFRSIYSLLNTVYNKEAFRFDNILDLLSVLGFTKTEDTASSSVVTQSRPLSLFCSSKFFGINQIIQKCEEIIYWPLRYRSYYETMGLVSSSSNSQSGHILLYGPSGCGKSSIPPELAARFQYNLIYLEITKIIQSSIGESEKEILRIFQDAKKKSPCFLVIDDFTSIFGKNENDLDTDNSVDKTLISALIHCFDDINDWNTYNRNLVNKQQKNLSDHNKEVQAFSHCNNILVIGITGEPWNIPPRLLSFGRFQEKIFISFLSDEDRRVMISKFFSEMMGYFFKSSEAREIKLDESASESLMISTKEFSGADIKHLFKLAFRRVLLETVAENKVISLILEECGQLRPSVPRYVLDKFTSWKNV